MKTPKEMIIELMTGISIEQWEENNKKLDLIMKMIKPSINVKYIIEWCNNGVWEELRSFNLLDEAEEYLQYQKESTPKCKFRIVRTEWQVIA